MTLFPLAQADFSSDGRRRYWLSYRPGAEPRLSWLLLNPSIAGQGVTGDDLDPTLRRVDGFSSRAGFRGWDLYNLYSLVSTDPRGLVGEDPADLSADLETLERVAALPQVVLAFGSHPRGVARWGAVAHLFRGRLLCLGTTRGGWPRHPLYLSGSAGLREWP